MSILPGKIGIVGPGSVGATIAYACMVRGVGKHISLFDVAKAKVEAEVLDLNHGLMFVPMAKVDGSDDLNVLERSDVIVVTAGAKQKPGQTRLDLAEANTAICRKLIPDLLRVAPLATLLMVTNPVDVLTYVALKLSGLESRRVLDCGVLYDVETLKESALLHTVSWRSEKSDAPESFLPAQRHLDEEAVLLMDDEDGASDAAVSSPTR